VKREFLNQVELLITTYEHVQDAERRKLDLIIDHLTAVIYELLHSEEIDGATGGLLLTNPLGPRVLH
jgi:hypothetical protein